MQWIEKLPYEVDIESLRNTVEEVKKVGPMVFQGSEFGYNNFSRLSNEAGFDK